MENRLFSQLSKLLSGWCIAIIVLIMQISAQDSTQVNTPVSIQLGHPQTITDCHTRLTFSSRNGSVPFCLDSMVPPNDSCSEITFYFKKVKLSVHFYYDNKKHWNCTGASIDSTENKKPSFNATMIYDNSGILTDAIFKFDTLVDSSSIHLDKNYDIVNDKDTIPPLDYEVSRAVFVCDENLIIGKIITDRVYEYPGGYGDRGQILNYPELSAFHWGGSVKIPRGSDVAVAAYTKNYWHLQDLPKIKMQDLEEVRKREEFYAYWRERVPPRVKKERTGKPFFQLKPL